MKRCPSCGEEKISVIRFAGSDPSSPTECGGCGKLFYLSGLYRNSLWQLINFGTPLVIIGSLLVSSWFPVTIFAVVMTLLYYLCAHTTKPVETNVTNVKKSRKYKDIIILLIIFLILSVGLYDYLLS